MIHRKCWVLLLGLFLFSNSYGQSYELIPYRTGEKWGLANDSGHVVVSPQYDEIRLNGYPDHKYYSVRKGKKFGILVDGEELIQCTMDSVEFFNRNLILDRNPDGYYNKVYHRSGILILPDPLKNISIFAQDQNNTEYKVSWPNGKGSVLSISNANLTGYYSSKEIHANFDSIKRIPHTEDWLGKLCVYLKNDTSEGFFCYQRASEGDGLVIGSPSDQSNEYRWVKQTNPTTIERLQMESTLHQADPSIQDKEPMQKVGRDGKGFEAELGKEEIRFNPVLYRSSLSGEKKRTKDVGEPIIKERQKEMKNLEIRKYLNDYKEDIRHTYYVDQEKGLRAYSDHYVEFEYKGKKGVVTETHQLAADYDQITGFGPFNRELPFFVVGIEDKKKGMQYGVISVDGTWKLPAQYSQIKVNPTTSNWRSATLYRETFALVQASKDGKWSVLGPDCKLMVASAYDEIVPIDSAYRQFSLRDDKLYGFYSTSQGGSKYVHTFCEDKILGWEYFSGKLYWKAYRNGRFVGYVTSENTKFYTD